MKRYLLLFALFLGQCFAQVPVTPIVQPRVTFVDAAGLPCSGCSLYSYAAGTTTPLATYTDASGTSQNTNPIILDAAGGANIWLGANSYKLLLKDPSGATIWSVDQVRSGSLLPCASANAIQAANSAVNGLNCDPTITINTVTHTINVGSLPTNHVTIGALGTPTSWTLDTTTPATAAASLNLGAIGSGTANQIATYPTTGNNLQGSSSIPDGITAITRSPGDNSTNPATTAYVALPGAINPSSVQVATGTAMTGNQGNGAKIQHSTGAVTAGNCAKYDADGNLIDAGSACSFAFTGASGYQTLPSGLTLQWATGSPCTGDCTQTVTFPTAFAHACFLVFTTNYDGGSTNVVKDWAIESACTTTGVSIRLQRRTDEGSFTATPQILAIGW
jgi:hypothetical protein